MFKFLSIAAVSAFMFAAPAAAVTVYSGTLDESDGRHALASTADYVFKDFNTNVANPGLTIGDDFTIFGYVAHKKGSGSKWTDGWTLDFGSKSYDTTFDWSRVSKRFDGSLSVGATDYSIANLANGRLNLGLLTGRVTFHLDPIAGAFSGFESTTWTMTATQAVSLTKSQIVATPLPMGAVTLLTGVAGFAAMRRRKKS